MVNRSKSMIKAVILNKRNWLKRLRQNGNEDRKVFAQDTFVVIRPPVDSGHLTQHVLLNTERGNPVFLQASLLGKFIARWADGNAGLGGWKKRRPLCNGVDWDVQYNPLRKQADVQQVSRRERTCRIFLTEKSK